MSFARIFALSSYNISKFFIYAALITPALVSTTMFFPFISGKVLYFRVVIELALLFFMFYFLSAPRDVSESLKKIFRQPLFIAASIFVAAFLLTSITGVNFYNSFLSNFERGDGAFQLLHLYIFFFLLLAYFPAKKDWLKLLKFSLLVSLFIALYAIAQQLRSPYVIGDYSRPPGPLGNPSYLSVYAMFHLLFALFVIYGTKPLAGKLVWLSIALLNLYALLKAQTRGTIIGLAVAVFIAFLILSFRSRLPTFLDRKRNLKENHKGSGSHFLGSAWPYRSILAALILFGAVFYFTRASWPVWEKVPGLNRFASEDAFKPFKTDSLVSRYLTWTSAIQGFKERPIFGWGAENFPYVFDKYYNPKRYGSESWFDRSHNWILDYLINGGAVLLAAYVGMFVVYYYGIVKKSKVVAGKKDVEVPPMKKPYALYVGFLTLPIAYLIQNLFLFDVLSIYLVLFTFFAFAIHLLEKFELTVPQIGDAETAFVIRPFSAVAGLLLVLFTGTLLYLTAYLPYKKNLFIREGLAVSSTDPFKGISVYDKALKFYSPIGQYETIEQVGGGMANLFSALIRNRAVLKPEVAPLTIGFANEVLDYAKRNNQVVSVKPLYMFGIANLEAGVVFQDPKYFQIAREIMDEGYRAAPSRFEFIFGLLDVALEQRDKVLAEQMLKRGRELRPDLEERYKKYEEVLGSFDS